jgi:uncharacterized protein
MSSQLIVFTRYPKPGKTKTRMIPILGKEGAATLQRQMTEHTLKHAIQLQQILSISITIYFVSGDEQLMQNWLGNKFSYQRQREGDLGQRMQGAFEEAFRSQMSKVIIIGTDCPELDRNILADAFDALDRHNLVLGPAVDGGYYLIGLNRFIPELFQGIHWGTAEVFAQTQNIARQLGLNVYNLPALNDIDRPEDLSIWQRFV